MSHDGLAVVNSLPGVAVVVVMAQDVAGGVMIAVVRASGAEAGTGESDNRLGMGTGLRETVLRSLTTATRGGCPDDGRPEPLVVCPV